MSAPDFATSCQHWFGPTTFLRCPYQPDFKDTDITGSMLMFEFVTLIAERLAKTG